MCLFPFPECLPNHQIQYYDAFCIPGGLFRPCRTGYSFPDTFLFVLVPNSFVDSGPFPVFGSSALPKETREIADGGRRQTA